MTESRWRNAHRRIVAADLRADDAVMPLATMASARGTTVGELDTGSRRARLGSHAWMAAALVLCVVGLVAMGPPVVVWIGGIRRPGWFEAAALALDLAVWLAMAYWTLIIVGYWRFRARQRRLRTVSRRRR